MAQDERDSTIWVKEGPGKISGAAEGPLKDLTFAAKDLYDVSWSMHPPYELALLLRVAVLCSQGAGLCYAACASPSDVRSSASRDLAWAWHVAGAAMS